MCRDCSNICDLFSFSTVDRSIGTMSSGDSGCSIFCCFRRPRTYSPAKKALEEDLPLNVRDVESTHGASNTETEANNLALDGNKESPEQNAKSVEGAADGTASTEAPQNGGKTNEAISESPSPQKEPPPPECANSARLTSSLGTENAEGGGVGNGELDVGDVTVKVCVAQLDADEEELAQYIACLEQLAVRLEAVADALEASTGSTGVNDTVVSGMPFYAKWIENLKN